MRSFLLYWDTTGGFIVVSTRVVASIYRKIRDLNNTEQLALDSRYNSDRQPGCRCRATNQN